MKQRHRFCTYIMCVHIIYKYCSRGSRTRVPLRYYTAAQKRPSQYLNKIIILYSRAIL